MRPFLPMIRAFLKTPGFTIIAVITLAFGIGFNTGAFSLINVMLLRPLPFPQSDQLVRLSRSTAQSGNHGFSPADFLELKREASPFGQYSAYTGANVALSDAGHPAELADALRVSADYFSVLKISPELGRTFRDENEIFGRHRVALLSHALWASRYGSSPEILGHTVRVDGEVYEVIGILPAWANDQRLIRQTKVFLPLAFKDDERIDRSHPSLNIIGRRGDATSPAQEKTFVAALGDRLAAQYSGDNQGSVWRSVSLLRSTGNPTGTIVMGLLLVLSAFVLFIACSNLANFFLTRAIARSHELSVRNALGASRFQLIFPFAVEAIVLAVIGGAGALYINILACHWLSDQSIAAGGGPIDFPLDWRVLSFALALSLLTALMFGIVPALLATRLNLSQSLKNEGRSLTSSRSHQRLRNLLVIAQFAMAMTLLSGAGVLFRAANNALQHHPGWNAKSVVEASLELPTEKYSDSDKILSFQRNLVEAVKRLPGAKAVCVSYSLPSIGLFGPRDYIVENQNKDSKTEGTSAVFNGVSQEYFDVTGTRLLTGRTFQETDTTASTPVVVINETLARALFPNANPIGHRIKSTDTASSKWSEIIGVAADVGIAGINQKPIPYQVYHAFTQAPWNALRIAVRADGISPESLIDPLRNAIAALDPDLPVRDLMSATQMIEKVSADLELLKKMLSAFAVLGLLLALLGIYGVMDRSVEQRTAEIGLRRALGAGAGATLQLILKSGMRLAMMGAVVGLAGATMISFLLAAIMPGIEPQSTLVFTTVTLALLGVAGLACYIPAQRATRIDPLIALRGE